MFLLLCGLCVLSVITFLLTTIRSRESLYCSRRATPSLLYRLDRGFAGEMQVVVHLSGQSVLKLRIKSTGTNSKRDLQGQRFEA